MTGARHRVALINNAPTPYRVYFHERLARELVDVECWSVFTHAISNAHWQLNMPEQIRPVEFGAHQDSQGADHWGAQPKEWRKAGRVIQWLETHDIQAVILGGYNDLGRLRIARWCRSHGVPCFLFGDSNVHAGRAAGYRGWLKQRLLSRILSWFTGVLCCGSAGEAYFQQYGVPPERIFRVPYDTDYDAIRYLAPERARSAGQRFGLDPDRRYLIYAGRLAPEKRVDLLLKAFVQLAEEFPGWDLLVVGSGPDQAALAALAAPVSARVHWTGFVNAFDDLAALYGHASAAVLPSDYEPWGVAVTEAATRMPVVASSVVGSALDVVRDGENGRLFRAGDLASLTECLRDVMTPARLARMTEAVPALFDAWRQANDPVTGLRRALRQAGLAIPEGAAR
ncbi:MAG: glycosyltransferase family 4 protein [Acidobacteria bacterium]|nr:glycosyltransferase family 4 protein [Acidobacteriota bacterium]